MRLRYLGALSVLALMVAVFTPPAQGQNVPGFVVESYATTTLPVELTFDQFGNLYTGVAGPDGSPLKVRKISPGGAPVVEYGIQGFYEPEAVVWDELGSVSGVPNSLLVFSADTGFATGSLFAILPNETVVPLLANQSQPRNVNSMEMDGTGRVIMGDDFPPPGEVFAYDGVTNNLLYTTTNSIGAVTVDKAAGYIYTAATDGVIRIHDLAGTPVADPFLAGTAGFASAIAVGPGSGPWGSDLYVIDRFTGELLRVDSLGTPTVIGTGFGNTTDDIAGDLTFGPDGNLYVSFIQRDEVIRVIPEPAGISLLALLGLAIRRR